MMNEETGEFCFCISDDVEVFDTFGAHRKFFRIGDDFIFDGDESGGVEEFDRNEDVSMFHGKIYGIF